MAQFDIKYLERTDTHISYCYFRVQFVNPLYLVVNFYIIVIRQALIQSKENAQYSLLFILFCLLDIVSGGSENIQHTH